MDVYTAKSPAHACLPAPRRSRVFLRCRARAAQVQATRFLFLGFALLGGHRLSTAPPACLPACPRCPVLIRWTDGCSAAPILLGQMDASRCLLAHLKLFRAVICRAGRARADLYISPTDAAAGSVSV